MPGINCPQQAICHADVSSPVRLEKTLSDRLGAVGICDGISYHYYLAVRFYFHDVRFLNGVGLGWIAGFFVFAKNKLALNRTPTMSPMANVTILGKQPAGAASTSIN
jgi:hypothetical protein